MSEDPPIFEIKGLATAENGEVILLTLDSGGGDISLAAFHEHVPGLVLQLFRAAGHAMQERGDDALYASKPISPFLVTKVQEGHTQDNDVLLSLRLKTLG